MRSPSFRKWSAGLLVVSGLAALGIAFPVGPAAAVHALGAQPTAGETAGHELAGTSWRLVEIRSMDDSVYVPAERDLYTLTFGPAGDVSIRADCNRGTGSWSVGESPSQLRFGVIAATQAMCPPESLHDRYMAQFQWVRSYVLEDGHLFLATMADGSILEFEPLAEPVATVLGEEIRGDDAREVQEAILGRLFDRFVAEHGIEVRESEVVAFLAHLDLLKARDRAERTARVAEIDDRLTAADPGPSERRALEAERAEQLQFLASLESESDLTPEERDELRAIRREMAESVIRQWKVNRDLYREYGGRIIAQQMGPEPLDAYRRFLEKRRDQGAFAILDRELGAEFWRYFTDDSIHDFYPPGSEPEASAFDSPPWR